MSSRDTHSGSKRLIASPEAQSKGNQNSQPSFGNCSHQNEKCRSGTALNSLLIEAFCERMLNGTKLFLRSLRHVDRPARVAADRHDITQSFNPDRVARQSGIGRVFSPKPG